MHWRKDMGVFVFANNLLGLVFNREFPPMCVEHAGWMHHPLSLFAFWTAGRYIECNALWSRYGC